VYEYIFTVVNGFLMKQKKVGWHVANRLICMWQTALPCGCKYYITPQGVIVIVKGVVYVECEKIIATSKYIAKIKE